MRTLLRPGHVWAFDDLPAMTIALDGAVPGPRLDPERQRFSFDHHEGCVRLITSATCQQVLDALLLGLDPVGMTVLVNDIDGDTVLSLWLLEHYPRWRDPLALGQARPLVFAVAASDAHGQVYPNPYPELAAYFYTRVMEPLREARGSPAIEEDARRLLQACLDRLESWWNQRLAIANLQPQFVEEKPAITIHGSWVFADAGKEIPGRRVAGSLWLYAQGFDRLVLCSRLADCRYRYTLARRSDLVRGFPLRELYRALNFAEERCRGATLEPGQTWGGSSTVGGSPRDGSALPPEQVTAVIRQILFQLDQDSNS